MQKTDSDVAEEIRLNEVVDTTHPQEQEDLLPTADHCHDLRTTADDPSIQPTTQLIHATITTSHHRKEEDKKEEVTQTQDVIPTIDTINTKSNGP